MRVILRSKPNKNWSGITRYKNCYYSIASYFTRSGRRYTGLTPEQEAELGEKLHQDLNPDSPFWDDFSINMTDKDLYLDTEDPYDELKYLFVLQHKDVQSSLSKPKPGAVFVIINQDAEAKEENNFNRTKRRAIKEFDKLNPDDMRKALRLFGYSGEATSNDVVEKKLFELVEGNPEKFLEKWVDNKARETEVLIENSIAKGIIKKNKSIYKFGQDTIGHNKQDAIDYLDNPAHQDIKLSIMKEIKG